MSKQLETIWWENDKKVEELNEKYSGIKVLLPKFGEMGTIRRFFLQKPGWDSYGPIQPLLCIIVDISNYCRVVTPGDVIPADSKAIPENV